MMTTTVAVRVFNERGELIGPIDVPKIVRSDDEWRRRLTPDQFRILRNQGTERPFCGTLLDNKKQGVYACAGCGLPLFSSTAKFNSGTGWPSFFQSIALENVAERVDRGHGMVRHEILCARCDGHLGHVFDDGPRPTGLRFCLNSESLEFTDQSELAKLADPVVAGAPVATAPLATAPLATAPLATAPLATAPTAIGPRETAVLAGGCFWCTELAFEQLVGVEDVESGYAGGGANTANYEQVCEGNTGHAEVIRLTYDPTRITFDQLLDVFFDAHDPTQRNRQGNDVGTQYRSAIFYANDAQRAAAAAKIAALDSSGKFASPIVTTLEPLVQFHPAEPYHQDYARHHPGQPYIAFHAVPKACKVREKHPKLVKE